MIKKRKVLSAILACVLSLSLIASGDKTEKDKSETKKSDEQK